MPLVDHLLPACCAPRCRFFRAAKPKMPLPAMSSLLAVGWGWTSPDIPSEAEMLQEVRRQLLLPLRLASPLYSGACCGCAEHSTAART